MDKLVLDTSPRPIGEIQIGDDVFDVLPPAAGDYDRLLDLQQEARKLLRLKEKDADELTPEDVEEMADLNVRMHRVQNDLMPSMVPEMFEANNGGVRAWDAIPATHRNAIVGYAFKCVREWTPASERGDDASGEGSAGSG